MIHKREAEYVVSATDAKNNFGSLLSQVARTGEAVVVERQGKPSAAMVSIKDYRRLRSFREEERRREARAALERLRQGISERNEELPELTEDQIVEIAREVRREITQDLFDKGLIKYAE